MKCIADICLDIGIGLSAEITYLYTPGRPGTYIDPPEPADIEVLSVWVYNVITASGSEIPNDWLRDRGWQPGLNARVLKYLRQLDSYDDVWYTLVNEAEECQNYG
jgi:hypothetical protein